MRYTPFASDIEFPFYTALASLKINHDKLDDAARKVLGFYEVRPVDPPNASCRMQIHGSALTSDETPAGLYRAEGMIKNVNTFEEYTIIDKTHIIQQSAKMIWDAICDGTVYSNPSLLASFIILSYADLKKYKFHYWFAFPALHSNPSWTISKETERDDTSGQSSKAKISARGISDAEIALLMETVKTWSYGVEDRQRGFFLIRRVHDVKDGTGSENRLGITDQVTEPSNPDGPRWRIATLSAYENGFFNEASFEDCYVCFADPSNYDDAPGWMLRNLLVLVKRRWRLNKIQVLRYRDTQSQPSHGKYKSTVLILESDTASDANSQSSSKDMPKVTGWERNPAGKLTSRFVNLAEYLDPKRLADQSVDLNLKLMKWRISPDLNLERIKHTKCLLLGAGTLGSYVARNLMGWGVSQITFVDNGSVSFSNPVRQPLYNFADCLDGGMKKALRASQALSEIYPGVDSTGHVLSVPMLGHPVIDVEKARAEFEVLQTLIDEHDVVFLLMDTREARWLPTVMGKAAGKIVMNAALGFDSYVVMRHGIKTEGGPSAELGCYFCNDVVAPMNSVKDQTLDQQCTVTRPGVAAIASALLVELLVSILQHPLSAAAPAPSSRSDDRGDHPLGLVPHQIRGFLATFENVPIIGRSYKYCSACSENIILTYKEHGWGFVLRALNEPGYVEELSGLKEVQAVAEASLADVEWDEDTDSGEEIERSPV
ncbi:hypothetical protein ASPCADRAFT_211689 [Aspergillus carbonarius ITEM 5010]|uniref:Ubiquitin-like modifier-activating enzyme ATG7 n=1 Tax=Aspergillus carbonarius (strain ITEM 5010) TaxID=602072 RepID=A0A1R3R8D2_ASPC5|nr:hypothetical protein ASPCADRAFT_211689 [Aspergillus carbonarius ITEM 5010]